jgi:hypothetical protein
MSFRDVTIGFGGLQLKVGERGVTIRITDTAIVVEPWRTGVPGSHTFSSDDSTCAVLLSGILRGLCGVDEPRFVSPILPSQAERLDCTQQPARGKVPNEIKGAGDEDFVTSVKLMQILDMANFRKDLPLKDRLSLLGERLSRDVDEDFCNALAEYIPCGDGEDLVDGARKLREELVRVTAELAAAKEVAKSGEVVHHGGSEAFLVKKAGEDPQPLIDKAVLAADGGTVSPFGDKPTEPQEPPKRRGRGPNKPKDPPPEPAPAAPKEPEMGSDQANTVKVEPVVVPVPETGMEVTLTQRLILLLSQPPMPIGVDPLDDRDQQDNYCDSAFMRIYYQQDVCAAQALARSQAGYDHKKWRPKKPDEMLIELSDKGAEVLADVFFQLDEVSGGTIPQLHMWVVLRGDRVSAAEAIRDKYAQIRARTKRA